MLVTGGAGYIGSHTVKALGAAGHHVIVFDNFSAGHAQAIRRAAVVVGDVCDGDAVYRALVEHRVTAVLHFAAWLSVADSVRDPAGYYANNVGGALSVLGAMARASVRALVFSSTAAVYGRPVETPISEDHPTQPINPYGETKLAVERALPYFCRAYGLEATSLRYFNAAGADPDGTLGEDHRPEIHLIPRAIEAALGGPALDVFGEDYDTPDGTCLRDYVHVSDVADAHVLALGARNEPASVMVFNVGNARPHSVREVIAVVERVARRPVPWRGAPRRAGDPAVLYASNAKISRELGWTPRFADLESMVETAWRWRRDHPHGYQNGSAS